MFHTVVLVRLDTTISAASKQEASEGGRLFKLMAKSFSKRYVPTPRKKKGKKNWDLTHYL
jgi:hypothetical protein